MAILFVSVLGCFSAFADAGESYDNPIWFQEGDNPNLTYNESTGVWYSFKVPPYSMTTFESTWGLAMKVYFTSTEEDAKNAVQTEENSFRSGNYPWNYINVTEDSVQVWAQIMQIMGAAPSAQCITVTTVPADGLAWFLATELQEGDNDIHKVGSGTAYYWYKVEVPSGDKITLTPVTTITASIYTNDDDAANETNAQKFKFGTNAFKFTNNGDSATTVYVQVKQTQGDAPVLNLETISTGIDEVSSNLSPLNSNLYNLAGQRVNNDAKGIVIKDGKKTLNIKK